MQELPTNELRSKENRICTYQLYSYLNINEKEDNSRNVDRRLVTVMKNINSIGQH